MNHQPLAPGKVEVIVTARDRPDFLRQTLRSILSQDITGFDTIVSDNSEGDAVERLVASEFPQVIYRRRRPTLSQWEHGNTILGEISAELVVFFHDDDIMEPDFVGTMVHLMDEHPEASAAGCNSWTLRGEERIWQRRMGHFRRPLEIRDAEELIRPYLDFTPILMPPPFPGYIYRGDRLRGLRFDPGEGGKYGDLSFLMHVLERGPFIWHPRPLMWYREHGNNDSSTEAVGSRLQLLRHIYANTSITRDDAMVAAYRFRFWLSWWTRHEHKRRPTPWRARIVRRFLFTNAPRILLTRPGLWLKLLAKLRRALPYAPATDR